MKRNYLTLAVCIVCALANAQTPKKVKRELKAQRTTANFKIDGLLEEEAWKNVIPATDFVEFRPTPFKPEDPTNKTLVYVIYDDNAIYVGGYCYERSSDSISKELIGRDQVGVNDFVGIVFDTYNDKINGFGFYVTPYGEQYDAKYSNLNRGEDDSWNAVWNSSAKIHKDGWSFEMRIPYSALRFANRPNQTWGLNITRRRTKSGQQYTWNPIDANVNGFVNQEGLWTGIEEIKAPVRLSLSPYFSAYLNHYPYNSTGVKNWTSAVNGGMDVKYGISEGFTLDMTLIPDFGQVQSDNQVLNLTPFEVKYNENRSFFTEGTELFSKGDLFYSRRIGSTPVRYYDVQQTGLDDDHIHSNEHFVKNPQESKLINATKVSGRTRHGLGIGFFNAVTKTMFADVEDSYGNKRRIETNPLTNYNIVVLDQTLKNNSSVSLINTNVTRNGSYDDANVTAGLFNLNNKKNTYNLSGKLAVSQIYGGTGKNIVGHSHMIDFGKSSGNFRFELFQDVADEKYDINDMGILFNNNYINHYLWISYRWSKPTTWYNRIQINGNYSISTLYKKIPGQFVDTKWQSFSTNVNGNIQMKNLWWAGLFAGYVPRGNDFYEPRNKGYSYHTPKRIQFNLWLETNRAKKYSASFNYFVGLRNPFWSPNHNFDLEQQYRFSDKFSINALLAYSRVNNDAGFYTNYYESNQLKDVIFSRRDLRTVQNVLGFKYNFSSRAGFSLRMRHYWSKVHQRALYDLDTKGDLYPTTHSQVTMANRNINFFNVDAVYTWQFGPGSFLNIVWKDQSVLGDDNVHNTYFKNFNNTISAPQNNNLSIKIIYYLDYLDFRKWGKKKKEHAASEFLNNEPVANAMNRF